MLPATVFAHEREETNASGVLAQSLQSELSAGLEPLSRMSDTASEGIATETNPPTA